MIQDVHGILFHVIASLHPSEWTEWTFCLLVDGVFSTKKTSPKMTQLQEISSLLLGDVKIQRNSTLVLAPLNFWMLGKTAPGLLCPV